MGVEFTGDASQYSKYYRSDVAYLFFTTTSCFFNFSASEVLDNPIKWKNRHHQWISHQILLGIEYWPIIRGPVMAQQDLISMKVLKTTTSCIFYPFFLRRNTSMKAIFCRNTARMTKTNRREVWLAAHNYKWHRILSILTALALLGFRHEQTANHQNITYVVPWT